MKSKITLAILFFIAYWSLGECTKREKIKKKLLSSNRISPDNGDGADSYVVDVDPDEQRRGERTTSMTEFTREIAKRF